MISKSSVLLLATLTTGLMSGLFYGFSVAINPALARLPDAAYIEAMQAINDAIQNPWFGLGFFGAPALLLGAAGCYRRTAGPAFRLLTAAALLYLIGSFGVTLGANLPLNEQLAAVSVSESSAAQQAGVRAHFATSWNQWHRLRTGASVGALALAIAACLAVPSAAVMPKR